MSDHTNEPVFIDTDDDKTHFIRPATHNIWGEDDGGVIGYMCKTDFECEMGGALGGNTIYPDIDDLKRHASCVAECGIVKVKTFAVEVIQESNYFGDNDDN